MGAAGGTHTFPVEGPLCLGSADDRSVRFSSDGKWIAFASFDGPVPAGTVPVGLLVPAVGATTPIQLDQLTTPTQAFAWYMPARAKAIKGVYAETLVLDLTALLADVVQQIGMPTHDG